MSNPEKGEEGGWRSAVQGSAGGPNPDSPSPRTSTVRVFIRDYCVDLLFSGLTEVTRFISRPSWWTGAGIGAKIGAKVGTGVPDRPVVDE